MHWQRALIAESMHKTAEGIEETIKQRIPIELGHEISYDLGTSKLAWEVGSRLSFLQEKCGMRAKFNNEYVLSSAFSFAPTHHLKFSLSDQLNARKLFTGLKDGIDYKYGFSIDVNFE